MDKISVKSTSSRSAECSDVVLRTTNTTRLVFRPMIVDNSADPQAAVNGVFIFQRKGPKDEWSDTDAIPLSALKKDEGYRLDIKAAELRKFFEELDALYQLHSQAGIPRGSNEFVRVNQTLVKLVELPPAQLRQFFAANRSVGPSLLTKLLAWASDADDPAGLVARLVDLGPANLRKLNAAVGLQNLKAAIAAWRTKENSNDEEFWQKTLTENSFVLERVFSWPLVIVKGKAYVGGKSVLNSGGNIVDFLVKNRLTNNAALIEIKTPATPLLGRDQYRTGVYNPAEELAGGVMQALNYKQTLVENYQSTRGDQGDLYESFDPECVVILGNATTQLKDRTRRKSFELFRGQLPRVRVITFDELFAKTEKLVSILESPETTDVLVDDEVPF